MSSRENLYFNGKKWIAYQEEDNVLPKAFWPKRLGLAALGGVIGSFTGINIISGGSISIPLFLRDGFIVLVLLPALLSLPTALIKHPTFSFGISLVVGGIVSYAFSIYASAIMQLIFSLSGLVY